MANGRIGAGLEPPASYDDLIEGQPSTDGPYTSFTERRHLEIGWPSEFGLHKYFRVVGFTDALDRSRLSLRLLGIKSTWAGYFERMLELVPAGWKETPYFPTEFSESLRTNQVLDAARGELQRFDRAALSILFLQAVLEYKKVEWPLYRYVRLRPVTFYIDGLPRIFEELVGNNMAVQKLQRKTDQPFEVLQKMAAGDWFVTRKTAELALLALNELAAENPIGVDLTRGLEIRCGVARTRSSTRRTIWPVEEEKVRYFPEEYLSPAAWRLTPEQARTAIRVPPF
jgi:hypothetical protein